MVMVRSGNPAGEVLGAVVIGGALIGAVLTDPGARAKIGEFLASPMPNQCSDCPPATYSNAGIQIGPVAKENTNTQQSQPAQEQSTPSSRETGSYTNTHESGKTYSGKGDRARSQASGQRVEKKTGDKHIATDWKKSISDRKAFKDESRRIDANGGAGSSNNHNQIEFPGKKYIQQDSPNQPYQPNPPPSF